MANKICGIYKITNKITGEPYIGLSTDVTHRLSRHKSKGTRLKKVIEEYGVDNFTFEIVEECSFEELVDKEKYYIKLFDAEDNGMNLSPGGETPFNTTGYYHVYKDKNSKFVQGYLWRYHYHGEQGKKKTIRKWNLNELKKEVLARGLKWEVIDEEKAKLSDEENEVAIYLHNHHVRNNSGFLRVSKRKCKSCASGYHFTYVYPDKKINVSAMTLKELEKKVKVNGGEWKLIDKEKAKIACEESKLNEENPVYFKTGFYHVRKANDSCIKQGFAWKYWYKKEGVVKLISSVNLNKLQKEVEKRGLEWKIIDEEQARKSLQQNAVEFLDLKNIANNKTGFYHVSKEKSDHYPQGFIWKYHYRTDDGKPKKIRRVDLNRLKEAVLSRGFEWKVINNELAEMSLLENNKYQTKLTDY